MKRKIRKAHKSLRKAQYFGIVGWVSFYTGASMMLLYAAFWVLNRTMGSGYFPEPMWLWLSGAIIEMSGIVIYDTAKKMIRHYHRIIKRG